MAKRKKEITIPHEWEPRDYQLPLLGYMSDGGKRAVAIWHRRAGKDSTALNWTAIAAMQRVGIYWHMLPQQAQARKVVWDAIDKHGRRMIDQAFPLEIREATYQNEMKIKFKNGSIYQLCGSDNYDSLVGSNPVGVVMSEYSVSKPSAWDYIRPILAENGGWIIFIYTPRGRNHGYNLYQIAQKNKDWFNQILTVDDTNVLTPADIQAERDSGMLPELVNQEYFCSFSGAVLGSYYGEIIGQLEQKGHITDVPYDHRYPVITAWDIGIDDETVIWFMQETYGGQIHAIDYLAGRGKGLDYYLKELRSKEYLYEYHIVPHDFENKQFVSGTSPKDIAQKAGFPLKIIPKMSPIMRITSVRSMLSRVLFDYNKCDAGLEALRQYSREYDEKLNTFKDTPRHDWASHAADAFGHFAVGYQGKGAQYSRNDLIPYYMVAP